MSITDVQASGASPLYEKESVIKEKQKDVEQVSSGTQMEVKKSKGITRRQMIAVTAAGAAFAIPGIAALSRWRRSRSVVVSFEGPFAGRVFATSEEYSIDGDMPSWLVPDSATLSLLPDESYVACVFDLKETPGIPLGPVAFQGEVLLSSGGPSQNSFEYCIRDIVKESNKEVNMGFATARVRPVIDPSIPLPEQTKPEEVLRIRWKITWG